MCPPRFPIHVEQFTQHQIPPYFAPSCVRHKHDSITLPINFPAKADQQLMACSCLLATPYFALLFHQFPVSDCASSCKHIIVKPEESLCVFTTQCQAVLGEVAVALARCLIHEQKLPSSHQRAKSSIGKKVWVVVTELLSNLF